MVFHLLCNLFNENDIQILVWIATWRSHGRIFAHWTCLYFSSCLWFVNLCPAFVKLNSKNLRNLKTYFLFKNLGFFQPCCRVYSCKNFHWSSLRPQFSSMTHKTQQRYKNKQSQTCFSETTRNNGDCFWWQTPYSNRKVVLTSLGLVILTFAVV